MWYIVKDRLIIDQLVYNFLPSWWQKNYGFSFGRKFFFDPDYRVSLCRSMEKTVFERFPGIHIGSNEPKLQVIPPDLANATTPAVAGCRILYPDDNYPWNQHLSLEDISDLKSPEDFKNTFPFNEITRQVKYLNKTLDQDVSPWWNVRGVLNDAMLIGGTDFFAELGAHTLTAQKLLHFCQGILTSVIHHNYLLSKSNDMTILTNCSVMMISPKMYKSDLFPYDKNAHQLVMDFKKEFGIHHCGYFEKYATIYRTLPCVHWLEIGWGSDIRTTLDLFPEAIVQYILSASFIFSASRVELQEKILQILAEAEGNWHRFRLSMPDIEYGTPDENIYEIYSCCKDGSKIV